MKTILQGNDSGGGWREFAAWRWWRRTRPCRQSRKPAKPRAADGDADAEAGSGNDQADQNDGGELDGDARRTIPVR